MSVFVRLDKQDAYITSYTAHKAWVVTKNDLSSYGIHIYTAYSSSGDIYVGELTPTVDNQYAELVYRNLHHLYYSRFAAGNAISSSYFTYDQTTLHQSASRDIYTTASLISIPKEVYGHAIKPGSFSMAAGENSGRYVSSSFVSGGFILETLRDGFRIYDDGEGVLRDADKAGMKVGDIVYTHGHIVLTDETTVTELQDDFTVAWQSSHTVYTHHYRCGVNESQLNYSQNPSVHSGSTSTVVSGSTFYQHSGVTYDFTTGSYFQPYVTTIGLYNDSNELVAVGKLAQPVPKSRYTDMTFVVDFDI